METVRRVRGRDGPDEAARQLQINGRCDDADRAVLADSIDLDAIRRVLKPPFVRVEECGLERVSRHAPGQELREADVPAADAVTQVEHVRDHL